MVQDTPGTMFHSRERKRQTPGVLINTPKHGDVITEEQRTPSSNNARNSHIPTGGMSLGKNNLNQSKASGNTYGVRPIPSTQFYNSQKTPEGRAMNTRRFLNQQSYGAAHRGRKIKLMPSPPPEEPFTQFRNASGTGVGSGKRFGVGMRGEKHEVVISDTDDEEVVETSISPEFKISSPGRNGTIVTTNGAQRQSTNFHSHASDIKPGESSTPRAATRQAAPLEKLSGERLLRIADSDDEENQYMDPRLAQKTVPLPYKKEGLTPLHAKMTSRTRGKKVSTGDIFTASASERKDKSRPLVDEASNGNMDAHLKLITINFFEFGQIQAEVGETMIEWNSRGDITVIWIEGGKRMSVQISIDDVKECLICQYVKHPTILLRVPNVQKYVDILKIQVGKEFDTYVLGKKTEPEITMFMPRKTDDLFDAKSWKELVGILESSSIPCSSLSIESFTLADSVLDDVPSILRKGNPLLKGGNISKSRSSLASKSKAKLERVKHTPSPNREVSQPLRISQRQMGKGTESEEEERVLQESVEQAAKNRPYIDPTKVRLQYPFDEAGGVKALQADIERLDDREFLNDTIIELGLKYLLKEIKDRDPDLYSQIYVFSTFFYKIFSEGKRDRKTAYEAVKRWTNKLDIFDKKYLVVPINEKMHWYLAILINPYYAVRRFEEKQKESQPEEGREESIDELATPGPSIVEVETSDAQEFGDSLEQSKDAEGDTAMLDEEKEEGELSSDKMAIDPSADGHEAIFQDAASEEELLKGYQPSPARIPVTDNRKRIGGQEVAIVDDEGDCTFVSVNKNTHLRSTPRRSQGERPGLSDGFGVMKGKLKESLKGGGTPATVIIPGESFKNDDTVESAREAASLRKRKFDEEDYQETSRNSSRNTSRPTSRAASPMRSRSGMTLNRSFSFTREEIQQKYQRWLREEAVVCVFDSLGSKHKAVSNAMKDYIWLEYNDKKGGEMTVEDVHLEHIDVSSPSQGNFCDCGLYLLHAFERFFSDPELMINEVLARRGGELHEHWQEKEAVKKREWWRDRITALAEEWESRQETQKRQKKGGKKVKKASEEQKIHNERTGEEGETSGIDSAATTVGSEDSASPTSEISTRTRGTDPVVDIYGGEEI